jgi:pyridoxamine 5'-phosphate oxidase
MTDRHAKSRQEAPEIQDFTEANDPFNLFFHWLGEAEKTEPDDPNAMAVATVDDGGLPNVRMILLKGVDQDGFVFYTNCGSAKGLELAANPKAALLFYWKSLHRQIRMRGPVEPVSDAEADAYFGTRSRESRIGAWASDQSRPLASRATLEARVALRADEFKDREVTRPPYWHGYRLVPLEIEFWRGGHHRLHDRVVFRRADPSEVWTRTRLYP